MMNQNKDTFNISNSATLIYIFYSEGHFLNAHHMLRH